MERDAPPDHDPRTVMQDWITIWQSQLCALALDREAQEAWLRWVTLWADTARAATGLAAGGDDADHRGAWATPPAGAAAAMAASDAGDDASSGLAEPAAPGGCASTAPDSTA